MIKRSLLVLLTSGLAVLAVRYARGPARWLGPGVCVVAVPALLLAMVVPAARDLVSGDVAVVDGAVTALSAAGRNPARASLHFGRLALSTTATYDAARGAIDQKRAIEPTTCASRGGF